MNLQAEEDALIARFSNLYAPAFAEIPKHLQTERVAQEWLTILSNLNFDAVFHYWKQIPSELITDDLRKRALGLDARLIQHFDPRDTEQYLDLFIAAYKCTSLIIPLINPDFRTSETVEAMLALPREFERSFQKNPWIAEVMTADQLEKASRLSAKIMAGLPIEKISPEALYIHLSIGFDGYLALHRKGKLRLAADFLKQGYWPEPDDTGLKIEKPEDAAQGLSLLMGIDFGTDAALYMAYLMTHPIEDVLSVMKTREHINYLLEMYSPAELRPFVKTHRHLKAALLEESLGL
jgi:hypothetical protein